MTRLTNVFVLLVAFAFQASAQDVVALESGKKVRGDVIAENDKEVHVVTKDAVLRVISRADVIEVKIGRAIKPKLFAKIKGNETDPDTLMDAAKWGQDQKSLAKDCQRLARRALGIDESRVDARQFIGQVKAGGVWYKNRRTAEKAFAKMMKAKGYSLVNGAWVSKKDKRQLSKKPGLFMLDGNHQWRVVDELMKERKMILLGQEWYRPEEKDLVAEIKRFNALIKRPFQGAKKGATTVVVSGRKSVAEKVLKQIDGTRVWFDEVFGPKGQSFSIGPKTLIVVLKDRQTYAHFLTNGQKIHGADSDRINFCLKRDSMSFDSLSRVSNQSEELWLHTLVSGTAAKMMRLWGDESYLAPPCLYVASGHWGELKTLGEIRIHFAKANRYDTAAGVNRKFRSQDDAKNIVIEAKENDRAITFDRLFKASLGGLTAVHEAEGLFVLQYLQEHHRKGLQVFVEGRGPGVFDERFTAAFKKSPKEIETAFWEWFEAIHENN
ncbi:MAG: hypothetical protein ACI97A_003309 [Planctomycetota bacterium]|jgi:hypothetical protein